MNELTAITRAEEIAKARAALKDSDVARMASLTTKEVECLLLTCKGLSANETAAALGVGYETIRSRNERIRSKLGVGTMVEAAVIAGRLGIA